MEIEKKYRIKRMPEDLSRYEKKEIEQGYLCASPVVRIRRSNDRYILTYKSKMGVETSAMDARVNEEVEVPLSEEGYQHLKEKIDDFLIHKTRYLIPLACGHLVELDVFHGRLEGLVFAEVEFSGEEDAAGFQPPEWFGENISQDERYSNSFLSTCGDLTVFNEV